jgi:hypothetical protein
MSDEAVIRPAEIAEDREARHWAAGACAVPTPRLYRGIRWSDLVAEMDADEELRRLRDAA